MQEGKSDLVNDCYEFSIVVEYTTNTICHLILTPTQEVRIVTVSHVRKLSSREVECTSQGAWFQEIEINPD